MFAPIPVSLITGFLGAGKTTLINRLLNQGMLKDTALIINEFGDVGIDHLLVETADEGIVELSDGCLCCTIRGDLVDTLSNLVNRRPAPSRIVIHRNRGDRERRSFATCEQAASFATFAPFDCLRGSKFL